MEKVSQAASSGLKASKRLSKKRGVTSRVYTLDDGLPYNVLDFDRLKSLKADGYNSKYLGKCKIRNATRRQKFRKPNLNCSIKYQKHLSVFENFNINVDKCVIIDGCYDTNLHTLQRQMTPDETGIFSEYPNRSNLEDLLPTIKVVLRKLKRIGILRTCSFDDVFETEISVDKKPGMRYEECLKQRTKKEALLSALETSKERWDYFDSTPVDEIEREKIHHGVYTIGARNKRDYDYTDGEVATSRAVHMPELHVELTSAPWCDAVISRILKLASGSIYIGNSLLDWPRLKTDLDDTTFTFEGDWKRFDSTLYLRMITCAVCIMRTFFDHNDEKIDSHFIAMYDSLAIKDYYVPRGKVFRLFHGLPSGVKSTALLGSIVNMIALVYCIGPEKSKEFNFIVGGDDFLVCCKSNKYNSDVLKTEFEKRSTQLGMKLKFLKTKYHESTKVEDCPCFYKYTIYDNSPVTPPSAVLERVFMPWNKNYTNDNNLLEFLWNVLPSLGRPMSHLYMFYDLLSKPCFIN
jgi:hypothetical protein